MYFRQSTIIFEDGSVDAVLSALVLCQVEFDSIVSWVEGIFPVGAVPCGCPHPSF